MVDLAHLEKMGRELKCPICWSILRSAVSLACNHVFCNSCIVESMKSVSDCPVCKLPFRRREVRPAPHMDNLVSIYKSMKVAAGTNVFSTPIGHPTQNAGNREEHIIATETRGKSQKKPKRKGSSQTKQGMGKTDPEHSAQRMPTNPSFPAKKRIHVTPYPVSETPLRPQKISKLEGPELDLTCGAELSNNKILATDNKGDPLLSPFFWLREDDEEKSPEKSSGQHLMETPSPQSAPCFSDIKDSDDEKPTTTTPTSKLNAAEDFDSEMFEWTQRACSPELCSTPQKPQTVARHRLLKIPEKECQGFTDVVVAPCAVVPYGCVKIGTTGAGEGILSKKRRHKSNNLLKSRKSAIKRKQGVVPHDVNGKVPDNYGEIAERNSPKPGRKSTKARQKSACLYQSNRPMNLKDQNKNAAAEASEQSPNVCVQAKDLNIVKDNGGIANRSNRKIKTTNSELQRKCMKRSNDDVQVKIREVVPGSANEAKAQDQSPHIKIPYLPVSAGRQSKLGKCSGGILDKRVKEIQKQQLGEPSIHEAKNQAVEQIEGTGAIEVPAASMDTIACENKQTTLNILRESKMNLAAKNTTKNRVQNTENIILRKCEKSHSPIQCAFCHSSNDTEDSGEMMHYFNGKPVAADFNGGINLIHSHKHCTEWAPDVYFEDDIAINLTSEVSRSRRIKCSCCGVNGAALGCYEKSCRKSFHFTCAKLIQECKWDIQNFVMLCPLHSSMKLPNEASESQRQSRKRSTPKGLSQVSSINKPCDHPSGMWIWPSGSPCKLMLCCSALSVAEKEAVSKFARETGVPISTTWNPEVTHVIASTDHNGAYKRTLKILKGILNGKWILRVDWVSACMEAMEMVDEEKFEVTVDVHGISGGPQLGRLRTTNKQPKLFNDRKFYFSGDYTQSYKGYLQDLVVAAGGAILQRKPISRDHERLLGDTSAYVTIIVFSVEQYLEKHDWKNDVVINHRRSEAQALADASGGRLAASTWIIDSIAACKLQPLT